MDPSASASIVRAKVGRNTGSPRLRVGIGAAIVLVLLGLGIAVLVSALGDHGNIQAVPRATGRAAMWPTSSADPIGESGGGQDGAGNGGAGGAGAGGASAAETGVIFVHVVGAVTKPGIFTLPSGARVLDAIAAAAGYNAAADQTQLNLARVLTDGEQIVAPVVGAAPVGVGSGGVGSGGAVSGGSAGVPGTKVNLNTADAATLETLPQVGAVMAAKIIAWRTAHRRFLTVQDLLTVGGIGAKTFAVLKPLVTV